VAHFAELDAENLVLRVIVVNNADAPNEAQGIAFCESLCGGTWVQTSYNGNMRKNYAGIGYVYDAGREAFIAPQPFASWALNEATCCWQAPVPHPEDGKPYSWDEARQAWQPRAKDELKQDADLK
jgi:hypothetical protein